MNNNHILLEGRGVTREFGSRKQKVVAVDHVDFVFHEGEIISIVGESGSGKTTLAMMIMGLLKISEGQILFKGNPLQIKRLKDRRTYWKQIQAVFQDPYASYNQFYTVDKILLDCLKLQGLKLSKEETEQRMKEACQFVRLKYEELYNKYPFELSGGQRQRLMIARIVMMRPKIVIADEPTSMVDACCRSSILEMLLKLRNEKQSMIVFVTHDLGLAYYVSDTIYIMEKGRFVEHGTADEVIGEAKHPYTRQLLADIPKLHEEWDLEY